MKRSKRKWKRRFYRDLRWLKRCEEVGMYNFTSLRRFKMVMPRESDYFKIKKLADYSNDVAHDGKILYVSIGFVQELRDKKRKRISKGFGELFKELKSKESEATK